MAIFTNQATLSYADGAVNSNIVTGEIVDALSVTKTVLETDYAQGDTLTYVVNIVNSSNTPYTGLTVTDNLGAYTVGGGTATPTPLTYVDGSVRYFSNGVLQPNPTAVANPGLTISDISVPANGNVTLIYLTRVNEFAPLDATSTITNTVVVTGPGLSTGVTATATIGTNAGPRLAVTKSVNPLTVQGNGPLTYTFVITNTGNTAATAADELTLSDVFDPRLNITDVTFNGTQWTTPTNYTYDPATGLFTTVEGQLTVPAATFAQNPDTGEVTVTPGTSTLTVTGTVV